MKRLNKIVIPTDLSEHSRRALLYGSWLAAEEKTDLIILHVANESNRWALYTEEMAFVGMRPETWTIDRVVSEATLDLNRFLEPNLADLKKARMAIKRVVLGQVTSRIIETAEQEQADLVIMSPRRHRGWRHLVFGGITDQVTRLSPCPVLSITPPLPSRPWRGKSAPSFFSWSRPSAANV